MFLFGISSLLNNMRRWSNPLSDEYRRKLLTRITSMHVEKKKVLCRYPVGNEHRQEISEAADKIPVVFKSMFC